MAKGSFRRSTAFFRFVPQTKPKPLSFLSPLSLLGKRGQEKVFHVFRKTTLHNDFRGERICVTPRFSFSFLKSNAVF